MPRGRAPGPRRAGTRGEGVAAPRQSDRLSRHGLRPLGRRRLPEGELVAALASSRSSTGRVAGASGPCSARLDPGRRIALGAVSVVVLLPLIHITVEVALIAERAPGLRRAGGLRRWGRAPDDALCHPYVVEHGLPDRAAAARRARVQGWRRACCAGRPDWVLCGLLAAAVAFLAFSAQTGQSASRYYIPSLTLTAIGFTIMLVRLLERSSVVTSPSSRFSSASPPNSSVSGGPAGPSAEPPCDPRPGARLRRARRGAPEARPQPAALAFVALLVLVSGSALETHRSVERWAADDESGWQLVEAVSSARDSGCRVAARGLDLERASALPVLVALRPGGPGAADCDGRALLVLGSGPDRVSAVACRPGGARPSPSGSCRASTYAWFAAWRRKRPPRRVSSPAGSASRFAAAVA